MNNPIIILCPIPKSCRDTNNRVFFGSDHFNDIGLKTFDKNMEVKYLYFGFSPKRIPPFLSVIILTLQILFTKHDILYFTVDPSRSLYLLSFLKFIKLYNKKMYAWSYFIHNPTGIKQKLLKIFYAAFDHFFLISETHVEMAVRSGILQRDRVSHINWGVDLQALDKLKNNVNFEQRLPVFIITGKAQRDFKTLLRAFQGIDNAILKIYTSKNWNGLNHQEVLQQNTNPNVYIYYEDELDLRGYKSSLDFVLSEMLQSSCSVIICNSVDYGIGFTQLLDALACSLPVIITQNLDTPIAVEKENVGYTVPAYNAEILRDRINDIIHNPEVSKKMGVIGRKLIEKEYNIENTVEEVLSIILQ